MMNPWRWVDPRVSQVRFSGVRAYLARRGYVERQEPNPDFVRFVSTGANNGKQLPYYILPKEKGFAEAKSPVVYFLTTFSEVEDRHPVAILEEILQLQESESAVASH